MDLVRVNNHRPALLHLPAKMKTHKFKNGEEHLRIDELGKALVPGGNNLAKEEWERSKQNKTVRDWLEIGWLSEGGDTSKREGPEPPKTLANNNIPAALAIVEGEDDADVLHRWLKSDNRPDVKLAITRRIEAIGAPKRKGS